MKDHPECRVEEKGSAFFVVTFLAIVAVVLVGAHLSTSLARARQVESQAADVSAFQAAESGLNAVISEVWTIYRRTPEISRFSTMDRLDGKFVEVEQVAMKDRLVGGSTFAAHVHEVRAVGNRYVDVKITSTGSNLKATRSLTAVVRYGRKPSQVFNHAYFINNFGWLWGSGITVNGSVRSNGNFSLRSAKVNGDVFASENEDIGAPGTIEGDSSHDSAADYNASGNSRSRPTDPSAEPEDLNDNGILDPGEDRNGNGRLDDFQYTGGYDGESERHEGQEIVEMPYLGDLGVYRDLAIQKGGKLSQGGTVLVNGVLGDAASEAKSIILIGTEANPVVIDGPVVIEQDVVIKGVIKGQGTIYAGRNVNIIGNLSYSDAPAWDKPVEDLDLLKAGNQNKDALGLAAKGSIIMGDYTTDSWKGGVSMYQTPPFTQSYVVDPTDASNGYVSYYDSEGRPVFDGDYTGLDGGQKEDGAGGFEARRYYESSFSDDQVHSLADTSRVTRIDAILYTNHLLSGYIGECTFNGTLVSRDEAILYTSRVWMNYDVRVMDDGYEFIDIFLPREPMYKVLLWTEGTPCTVAEAATESLEN